MGFFKPNIKRMVKQKDVDGLIAALEHSDFSVRREATVALGDVGDVRAEEPLKRALLDGGLRHDAMEALHKIGCGPSPWDKVESAPALTWYWLYGLLDADPIPEVVNTSSGEGYLLTEIGEAAVGPLLIALKNGDQEKQKTAAEALGRIGGETAVDPLIEALQGMGGVQSAAVKALGRIGDPRAAAPLIRVLNEADTYTRRAVVQALGALGDARAVEPLIDAMKDKDAFVRKTSTLALGKTRDTRAFEPLIQLLESEDAANEVACALVSLGDERAVQPVLEYVKGASDADVWPIAGTFGEIGKKEDGFDAVYAEVAKRLDLPKERGPMEEDHYEGRNIEKLIAVLREVISTKTPTITKSLVSADHEHVQRVWHSSPLHHGTLDKLEAAIRPLLEHDLSQQQFTSYRLTTSYFHRYTQLDSIILGAIRSYRIWKTKRTTYYCVIG